MNFKDYFYEQFDDSIDLDADGGLPVDEVDPWQVFIDSDLDGDLDTDLDMDFNDEIDELEHCV